MTPELSEVNDNLIALVADHEARVRVVVETGYDEAGLVATASGYLRLAQTLVKFVLEAEAQRVQAWTVNGLSLPGSSAIGSVFGPDEIRIDSMMLAASEAEVTTVSEYFQSLSPKALRPAV